MKLSILIAVSLALTVLAVAPGTTASACDPDAGPFDSCNWDCSVSIQGTCDTLLTVGGAIWKCVFVPTCP